MLLRAKHSAEDAFRKMKDLPKLIDNQMEKRWKNQAKYSHKLLYLFSNCYSAKSSNKKYKYWFMGDKQCQVLRFVSGGGYCRSSSGRIETVYIRHR